jgi:hypothetical protein
LHIVADPKHNLFHDLPADEQDHWISLLRPQPWIVHQTPLKNTGYLNVSCGYIKAEKDRMCPLHTQEMGIAGGRQMGAEITEYMTHGGHDPFLSDPKLCAKYIADFGEKCRSQK